MRRLTWWKIWAFKEMVKRGYSVREALSMLRFGRSTYVKYYDLIWDDELLSSYVGRFGLPAWFLRTRPVIPKHKPENFRRMLNLSGFDLEWELFKSRPLTPIKFTPENIKRIANLYKDVYKNVHRKPISR